MMTGGRATAPNGGDVILVPFPFAEFTATKARPALVVSGRQFFKAVGKLIVAAITSNVGAHRGPTNFCLAGRREVGLLKPSVITSWPATLSPDPVLMKIGALSKGEWQSVASRLRTTLEI